MLVRIMVAFLQISLEKRRVEILKNRSKGLSAKVPSNFKLHPCIKCALPGLTKFLAVENPFKKMKNTFYFTLKALFVWYSNFSLDFFSHARKWFEKKTISKRYCKIMHNINWKTNFLQNTYCPILSEVKANRQRNLVS